MDLLIFWDEAAPSGIQSAFLRDLNPLLPIRSRICESPVVVSGFIPSRKQTNATVLLDSLDLYKKRSGEKDLILLVVSDDLCRSCDEYLFGLARRTTGNAVVSTARMDSEFYGKASCDEDLLDRLVKESAHEVGHLLGLAHCQNAECIMFNPLLLDDMSRQKRWFCPACLENLQTVE